MDSKDITIDHVLRAISEELIFDKSTLDQEMAWCHQAASQPDSMLTQINVTTWRHLTMC